MPLQRRKHVKYLVLPNLVKVDHFTSLNTSATMLPLYAVNNLSVLRSQKSVRLVEKVPFNFKKPVPGVDISQCEKLLECISLEPYTLPPKCLTYGTCDHLFGTKVFGEVTTNEPLTSEEVLRMVFNDALRVSTTVDVLIPTFSCFEIDMQTEVDTLARDRCLDFLEETVTRDRLFTTSAASDPLSTERMDGILVDQNKPSQKPANFTKDILEQLSVRARGVTHHRRLLETIPFNCSIDMYLDPPPRSPLSIVEFLLQPKELFRISQLYKYGNEDFTEKLLQKAELSVLRASQQRSVTTDASTTATAPLGTPLLARFQDILPKPVEMPVATFCGEVGLILPNLATERHPSALRGSSSQPRTALDVLDEMQSLRTTTLTTTHPRIFLYDARNQPYFSAVMERLIDLQSPHELMPIRHRSAPADNPVALLTANTLHELDLQVMPLARKVLQYRPSPLHPSALDSLPLHDEDIQATHPSPAKRRKVTSSDGAYDGISESDSGLGARAREFVQTAALNAMPDQQKEEEEEEEEEEPVQEEEDGTQEKAQGAPGTTQKRKIVESEDGTEPSAKHARPADSAMDKPQPDRTTAPTLASQATPQPRPPSPHAAPGRLGPAQENIGSASPVEPPAATTSTTSTSTRPHIIPSFHFNLGLGKDDLVEQYLRLQRGEGPSMERNAPMARGSASGTNYVTPPRMINKAPAPAAAGALGVTQVTPARIPETEAVRLRLQQLSAHNTSAFHATEQPLAVLISESFLTKHFPSVAGTVSAMGVTMIDCPLQEPVSIVLDHLTAVCVVSAVAVQDKNELKGLVKKLSEITFKFTKVVVIVLLDFEPSEELKTHIGLNQALLTLTQAVSRFPAAVTLRQCSPCPTDLTALLGQLCTQSLRDAVSVLPVGASARHFHRPFLDRLQHCDAKYLAHCEFLQLFPTLNFYTAAALLHHHPLRELVGQRVGALYELFARQYVCSEELRDQIKSFVTLLEAHAGLELHTG